MRSNSAPCDLIVGGDSKIGRQLRIHLTANGAEPLVTSRRAARMGNSVLPLDLSEASLEAFERPIGVAWLCAAITSLEECHRDPEATRRVNVAGTIQLAERLLNAGAFVVFLSTNLVFDGERPFASAEEPHSPRTEYGRQKAIVEAFFERHRERAAIVRFTKVLSPGEARFREWRDRLASGGEVRAFGDLPFSPIPLALVVEALARIGSERMAGLWQFSGAEELTYREAAMRLAAAVGADPSRVVGASASELGYYQCLPRHATLDASRAEEVLQFSAPPAWPTILESVSTECGR
jgi:dTDP-4-dehydrorhamnose reductase